MKTHSPEPCVSGLSCALRTGNVSLTTSTWKFHLSSVNVKTSFLMLLCWEWFWWKNTAVYWSNVVDLGGKHALWMLLALFGLVLGRCLWGPTANPAPCTGPGWAARSFTSLPDPRVVPSGSLHLPVSHQWWISSQEKCFKRTTSHKIISSKDAGSCTWRNLCKSSNFLFVSHWKGYIKKQP